MFIVADMPLLQIRAVVGRASIAFSRHMGHNVNLPSSVRTKTSRRRLLQDASAPPKQKSSSFALLIDGDVHGPSVWSSAQMAVKSRGDLIHSYVFASPGHCSNAKWKASMATLGIDAISVPRKTGGSKDPNDIAIGMEAGRLVSQGKVNSIAILASDADFKYLAERLHLWGYRCLAVFLEGERVGIAKALEQAGADIAWIRSATGETAQQPKLKAILHPSGRSAFEAVSGLEFGPATDTTMLARTLHDLNFLDSLDDPLVPAIAKFFHVNAIGALTVWPGQLAIQQAASVVSSGKSGGWRKNSGDLVFALPVTSGSCRKTALKKYGTRRCSWVVEGGGPFLLKSSSKLADEVLVRLGFLDGSNNSDFSEAVDVFTTRSQNMTNLRVTGLMIPTYFDANSKRALLHTALVSTRLHGVWTTAPKDTSLRDLLFSRRMISNRNGSHEMVASALRRYACEHGLQPMKTYNGLVGQVTGHLAAADPSRRRS